MQKTKEDWNDAELNKLIDLLKSNEYLYNKNHANYNLYTVIKLCDELGKTFSPPKSGKNVIDKITYIKNEVINSGKRIKSGDRLEEVWPKYSSCKFIESVLLSNICEKPTKTVKKIFKKSTKYNYKSRILTEKSEKIKHSNGSYNDINLEAKRYSENNKKDGPLLITSADFICCIPNCWNFYPNSNNIIFYNFPDLKLQLEKLKLWIKAIRSKYAFWKYDKDNRICSSHFKDGRKSNDPSHVAYIPTIFPIENNIKSKLQSKRKKEPLLCPAENQSTKRNKSLNTSIKKARKVQFKPKKLNICLIRDKRILNPKTYDKASNTSVFRKNVSKLKALTANDIFIFECEFKNDGVSTFISKPE